MLKFIKQAFIVILCLSGSLAHVAKVSESTKYTSLNIEPCLTRPALFDLNSNKLHYYPYMVSLNRCNSSINMAESVV